MLLSGPRLWRSAGCALVIAVSCLTPGAFGAGAPAIGGTLPEDYLPALAPILQVARQRSPQVIAAEIEVALSEAQAFAADAPRLPSLSANLNFTANQTAVPGDVTIQTRSTRRYSSGAP